MIFSYASYSNLRKDMDYFWKKIDFSKMKRLIKNESEIKLLKRKATILGRRFDNFANFIQENGKNKSEKELFSKLF